MKTKLNIFCLCIIVSLILSASMTMSLFVQIFTAGIKGGVELAQSGKPIEKIPHYVTIFTIPTNLFEKTGTVENTKDGTTIAIKPIMSVVDLEQSEQNAGLNVLSNILSLLLMVGMIYALVQFIKLIRNINRGNIFEWKNVKHLRKLGWALLAAFGAYFVSMYLSNYQAAQVLSLKGCDFSVSVFFSDPTLILGFSSLLVAEVFAMGLRMKEEQELTI